MQQALDALGKVFDHNAWDCWQTAVDLLRARLAQPEPEPVAWMQPVRRVCTVTGELEDDVLFMTYDNGHGVPLYTAPQQCEWQGLTDEDRWELVQKTPSFDETVAAVEAKLKEKNT
jgi:hypothetical protein